MVYFRIIIELTKKVNSNHSQIVNCLKCISVKKNQTLYFSQKKQKFSWLHQPCSSPRTLWRNRRFCPR